MNEHPVIKYSEFKKKAIKFYYKNNCNFTININTFKNIYYNWRKGNVIFKKYSIFEYNKTLNGMDFLKDYQFTHLYNKSGKSKFIHEHAIFCSDYFIKRLRSAKHWYIDCTFIVPPNFKQLLVIMYRDEISGIRYPGLFGLINNKKKEGYLCMFKKIKEIITIEETKDLSIYSYSIDFEEALLETCKIIFPKARGVGCYYHYCKNLYKYARQLNLFQKDFEKESNIMLSDFYKIPYRIEDNGDEYLNSLYKKYSGQKYINLGENFLEFIE